MSAHTHSLPAPPLRKVAAFHDLPSLATPGRQSNPSSYPFRRPLPGARVSEESPLLLSSSRSQSETFNQDVRRSIDNWLSAVADAKIHEMNRLSEKHGLESSSPGGNARAWIPIARRGSWALTPRRLALMFGACLGVLALKSIMPRANYHRVIPSHFSPHFHLAC
jgi:hypothetical protein